MGTNYYRIPKVDEINSRYQKLTRRLQEMDMWNPSLIEDGYRFIENPEDEWSRLSPWDEFTEGTSVHLGKRSMGWKFCWNFNNNKYYSNKEELLDFIRKGRVVDEYGSPMKVEEFIEMSLSWGQPDGMVADKEYFDKHERLSWFNSEDHYDKEIDGLRVSSSTEFS
jgi:hypothetical protein